MTPVLRTHPPFTRVWGGQTAGAVADQILPVALSLYALDHGGGPGAIAAILAGHAAALVICLLADRVSRTRILLIGDLLRAAVVAATLLSLNQLPLVALAAVTALCGAAEAFSRPALRALVPALLPTEMLSRGNALVSAAHRGAAMVGALSAAAVVAALSVPAALAVAAALFAAAATTVAGIRDARTSAAAGRITADIGAGIQAIRRRPWVGAVIAAVAVQLFAGTAPALVLLPVIADRDLGGSLAYGAVLAAGALPAVAVAARWRPDRPGLVAMLALTAYAAVPASLAVPLPLLATVVCFAVGGFAVELYFVYWLTALQQAIPTTVLGKVLAVDQLSAYALLPVGYALAGPIVAAIGERPTLVTGTILTATASVLALLVPGVAHLRDRAASSQAA